MKLTEIPETERLTPQHYTAIRSDGLTYMTCLMEAAGIPELVAQVDRLYGTTLVSRKSPIESMVDNATGKTDADMQTFARFRNDRRYYLI